MGGPQDVAAGAHASTGCLAALTRGACAPPWVSMTGIDAASPRRAPAPIESGRAEDRIVRDGLRSEEDVMSEAEAEAMADAAGTGIFDVAALAAALPGSAQTLLVDTYLTDREAASARVFRVYRPTPPHYHATCDEYLYCLSGRGTVWLGDPAAATAFGPGQLLVFEKGTVHAMPEIDPAEKVVFLAIDTPRRAPTDIVFVNPEDGSPATFMARNAEA